MLTQEKLKQELHYDPLTGEFTWLRTTKGRVAGRRAGTTRKDNGYRQIHVHHKTYLAHRLAYLYMVGCFPENVDHKNCVPGDDRWENLRAATRSQNSANRKRKPGKFLPKGVKLSNGCVRRWSATLEHRNRAIHLGSFASPEEAGAAYRAAAQRVYGEFGRAE